MGAAIREPVAPEKIEAELTPRTWLRSFRGIDIHFATATDAPALMQEIGRIREIEFRREGGGTGKSVDIDEFDTMPGGFGQLVAWDPECRELVGMYRLASMARLVDSSGTINSPTARLFSFTREFVRGYAGSTVELGRSVVNRSARRSVMGLFCVWAGLGAVVAEYPDVKYFFGKVTSYERLDEESRDAMYEFLETVCPDGERLLAPRPEYADSSTKADVRSARPSPRNHARFAGMKKREAFELLLDIFRERGEQIPPLLISYLELSDTMRSFGTARNPHFGDVLETAIMVTIADIGDRQRRRFIESYTSKNPSALVL